MSLSNINNLSIDSNSIFLDADVLLRTEIEELTRENNKIWSSPDHDRREYVHSFFQYPAMMVPVVQKRIIEIIVSKRKDIKKVFDPFMGSGTSLVACMELGLDCYGQDVNPLAVLVARTRTGPFYFKAIKSKKDELFKNIDSDSTEVIDKNFFGIDKWFKKETSIELSKIVRAIRKEKRLSVRRFYWVILAETVRVCSNDRTSTFKLHIRSESEINQRNISSIDFFKKHFIKCLEDIEQYSTLLSNQQKISKGAYINKIKICLEDTKNKINVLNKEDELFDLVITSPPYGDNKTTVTYGQHSYLPLQWIDLKDIDKNATKDYLSSTLEIDSRGLGGRLESLDDVILAELFNKSVTLKNTYDKLSDSDLVKKKKVICFFRDIYNSIKNINNHLKKDGYQVWTIGNRNVDGIEIPNIQIMSEFIISEGSILVQSISREILNRRMARRNRSSSLMTFEDILIFRKVG